MTDLAQSIEYVVEEDEYGSSGHLGDVVERFTGIVAYASIRVFKTG